MKSYLAQFSSPGAETVEATVLLFDREVHIGYRHFNGQHVTAKWAMIDTIATYDLSRDQTKLRHAKDPGVELLVTGRGAHDHVKAAQEEHHKPWHKKEKAKDWSRNLLIFLGIAAILVLLYFLLVPWMSEKLASKVSVKTEQQLGDAVYHALVSPDQENPMASVAVNAFFVSMNVKTAYDIRITVVNGETINAFALPGGRIVVYSALLNKMESYPELAALLAHEFTHINQKHTTRSVFRRMGSKVFLSLLFGKFGSVTSVLVDHADNLRTLKYSRSLEKEADMLGLALIQQRQIDPAGFAELFRHLKESAPAGFQPEYLASHPDIDRRINYIREAGNNAVIVENEELKSIFEKIKQNIQP